MAQLNIDLPPPKDNPDFDKWLLQTTQYLRDYLGLYESGTEVDFIQSGTGAVTRTMQNKARDIVSVKDYGATGNGTTDDRSSISTANTDATGYLYYPPGTYKISSNLTLTLPFIMAPGAAFSVDSGKTLTVTGKVIAGNHTIFSGAGSVVGLFGGAELNVRWFGAVADGDPVNGTGTDDGPAINRCLTARDSLLITGRGAIYIPAGIYNIETPVEIIAGKNIRGDGIYATFLDCKVGYTDNVVEFTGTGGPFSTMEHLAVTCLAAGSAGQGIMVAATANGTLIKDIYVGGFNTAGASVVLDATDVFLSRFLVENNTTGILCNGAHCNILHGTLYGNTTGLQVANSSMSQLGWTTVTDVRVSHGSGTGFLCSDAHMVKFVGCSVNDDLESFGNFGIDIAGSSNHIELDGCSLRCGTQNDAAYGIRVTGTSNNIKIANCTAVGWLSGMVIDCSGRNIVVTGGSCSLNKVHGILCTSYTGLNLIIDGVLCDSNGTGAANDCGINAAINTANQRLLISSCICGQASGAGLQDYGILIDANSVNSSKAAVTGNITMFNASGDLTVTGTYAAQVTQTGNVT